MSSFCPNCGAPTSPGERFCGSCGTVLESTQAAAPTPESPVEHTRVAGSRISEPINESPAPSPEQAADPLAAAPQEQAPQWGAPQVQQVQQPPAEQWGAPQAQQPAQQQAQQPPAQQWGAPQAQQPQNPQAQQWGAQQQAPQGWQQQPQQPPAQQAQQQWGAPQAQQPQNPQAQQWGAQQQPQQQWGAPQQQPGQPWGAPQQQQPWGAPAGQQVQVTNPFKGTTVGDWIRDGAAVVLGFMTLGYVWTMKDGDSVPWWAIVSAILTALSVVVSYLPRMGLPVQPKVAWLAKVGLNLPSVVSIVVALVLELVHLTPDGYDELAGLGLGVVILSMAVALAVAPRSFESSPNDDRKWSTIAGALTGVGLVAMTLAAVGWIIESETFSDTGAFGGTNSPALVTLGVLLVGVGLVIALSLPPLLALMKGRAEGAVVLGVVGLGVPVAWILASASDKVNYVAGQVIRIDFGTLTAGLVLVFLTAAGGAFAVSAPVLRMTRFGDHGMMWVAVARLAALTGVVALVVDVVGSVLGNIGTDAEWGGRFITTLILSVLVAALLAGVVATAPRLPGGTLQLPVLMAAVAVVLGIVVTIMAVTGDTPSAMKATAMVPAFFLPVLATVALTVPGSMRREFAPLMAPKPAQQPWGAPQAPGAPQQWGAPQGDQWGAPQGQPQQQWGAPQQPQSGPQPGPQAPQHWGAPQAPQQPQPPQGQPPQQWGPPQ